MKNKRNPRVKLTITTLQARIDYMEQLVDEGIFGSSVEEVADFFIAEGINRAMDKERLLLVAPGYRAERENA
jgi:hypothetical protein